MEWNLQIGYQRQDLQKIDQISVKIKLVIMSFQLKVVSLFQEIFRSWEH